MEVLAPGREAMTAFRLQEAERYFQQWVLHEETGSFATYYLTMIAYWKAMIKETPEQVGAFLMRAGKTIDQLKQQEESPWNTFFLAEVYLQRAVVQIHRGKYLKGMWDGKRAFKLYKHAVSMWPTFYDAYKGLGLLHVVAGSVPRSYRWLLNLFGYGGSVEQGIKELEQAAERSYLSREEATVYVALVDLSLNEALERGEERLSVLYEEKPWSPLAAYFYAYSLLKNRKAVEAEHILRKTEQQLQESGYTTFPFITYYLGDALFRQNRFQEAAHYFQRFLDTFQGKTLVPMACVKLGLSLEMVGDYPGAVAYYRRAHALSDFDIDKRAERIARERLQRPMTPAERMLLQGANAYDGGRYEEAIRQLRALFEDEQTPPALRTEAAYRLGRTYHALGDHERARTYYRYAVTHVVDPRAKWSPWAQFYLGELAEAEGRMQQAREAYRAALDWKGPFDYEKALEQRARVALSRLR